MSKGKAVLVGLKAIDPATHHGANGQSGCWGCELDVDNVARIAAAAGFESTVLKTRDATKKAVLDALGAAAGRLEAGDTLLFYYSGHGGQKYDWDGDEGDGLDETLVTWDTDVVDDDLNKIWKTVGPGVRILMISDSCNAGTNYKAPPGTQPAHAKPTPVEPMDDATAGEMPAQMIHMGGCRDGFTSTGYLGGGAFTISMCNAYGAGFPGNYRAFYDKIVEGVTTGQNPTYSEYGRVTDEFRNQSPFTI